MPKIRIDSKTGFAYIPKELRDEGFVGDSEYLPNAITLTIFKPGASLERVRESLYVVLQDIELRINVRKEKDSESLLDVANKARSV